MRGYFYVFVYTFMVLASATTTAFKESYGPRGRGDTGYKDEAESRHNKRAIRMVRGMGI